jgi:hypothetical protein
MKSTQIPSRFQGSQSSLLPVLAILFAMIIGILFTYDLATGYLEKKSNLESAEARKIQVGTTLESLKALEASLSTPEAKAESERYAGVYREDQILSHLFETVGTGSTIGNISLSKGEKLPSGISLAALSVDVETPSLESFLSLLDRLVDENAKKRYLVKGLNFAYDTSNILPISTTLQL